MKLNCIGSKSHLTSAAQQKKIVLALSDKTFLTHDIHQNHVNPKTHSSFVMIFIPSSTACMFSGMSPW